MPWGPTDTLERPVCHSHVSWAIPVLCNLKPPLGRCPLQADLLVPGPGHHASLVAPIAQLTVGLALPAGVPLPTQTDEGAVSPPPGPGPGMAKSSVALC